MCSLWESLRDAVVLMWNYEIALFFLEIIIRVTNYENENNNIMLFICKAYALEISKIMLDMILLGISNIFIPLLNRGGKGGEVA